MIDAIPDLKAQKPNRFISISSKVETDLHVWWRINARKWLFIFGEERFQDVVLFVGPNAVGLRNPFLFHYTKTKSVREQQLESRRGFWSKCKSVKDGKQILKLNTLISALPRTRFDPGRRT